MAVAGGILVFACIASGEAAADLSSRADAAARSGNLAGLGAVVRDAGAAIRDAANPRAPLLDDIIGALTRVESSIGSLREARERAVEDDEAGLEALYESKTWLRFDHLEGELQYWRGWAHFRRASGRAAEGSDAAEGYRAARRDFSRAMRNIRDPAVARETLLASAIAERGAGSNSRSAATLKRVEELFADAPAEFQERLRLERARTEKELGRSREVLALTVDADLGRASGRELADLRLRTLLAEPQRRLGPLAAAARPMLQAGGDAAARAVTALEGAKLSSAVLRDLKLGAEGNALEGLALLREERFEAAADKLSAAARGPLAGLRDDIVLARLAEAQLRARRGAAAFATCERIRTRFPNTTLRSQVARYGYNAAQLWNAGDDNAQAQKAVVSASAWVLADAPRSEEAAEVRVQRAMTTASRSAPDRALRVLENLPPGAPGAEAVTLQKALLRSAKVQTALERSLRRTASVRREADRLHALLREIPAASPIAAEYREEIAISEARARIGLGYAGALEQLRGLPRNLEVERTRIVGLWVTGDRSASMRATEALLASGPGSARRRFGWALPVTLAASEQRDADPAALRSLLRSLRAVLPADFEAEFRMELALREARAAQRAGDEAGALALVNEVRTESPSTLSNLVSIAEILERGGNPAPATEVWHQISEVSDRAGDTWIRARVGVARSLRATPGRAQDGCDVAMSLVVSGRSLIPEVEEELRTIARSCDTLSAGERDAAATRGGGA